MEIKKIFFSLCKTLGFFILSFIPVFVYIVKYSITHHGVYPTSYQEYAIRILSICFPIIATRLCFEKNNAVCSFFAVLSLFVCVFYLGVFEQQSVMVASTLDNLLTCLTIGVYIGSFIFSFMTYYLAPISEKKIERIGRNRDESADKIQSKVIW